MQFLHQQFIWLLYNAFRPSLEASYQQNNRDVFHVARTLSKPIKFRGNLVLLTELMS